VPTRKWVHELLKQEGRLSSWDRQFLQCLQEMGKCTRADLPLTKAQWQCVESIAEKIGWRPKDQAAARAELSSVEEVEYMSA
jgi:hypothetical protein